MTKFRGGEESESPEVLEYEDALEALLSLIGRNVLVLFSGASGPPFIGGVLSGRLDRGEADQRLRQLLLRGDAAEVETLFFHVGSRQTGFVVRPDEFERAFWPSEGQLEIHLGVTAVTIIVEGDLDEALER